jgi:hypothetical protein
MVHPKTMKIVLFTIDSRFNPSPKYGGQGVFKKILRCKGQCLSPQTAPALCDNAVLPFQV